MVYEDIKVCYIPDKYWALNSVLVPSQRIVVDEHFVDVKDIIKTEGQRFHFNIYWAENMVTGEVLLPGEWNYCIINNKFFHMEKTSSQGYIEDSEVEWFFYTLIYDDWQNDWLLGNVRIEGTINLTGDKELVKRHLVQVKPLVNQVNNFRFLNGTRGKGTRTLFSIPEGEYAKKWESEVSAFSSSDLMELNRELSQMDPGEPDREKLNIPIIYRAGKKWHWKYLMLRSLKDLYDKGLYVFDVAQDNQQRAVLETIFRTRELYVVSTKENKIYNYAKTWAENKFVTEIDLKGVTDVIELNPTTLVPKYTSVGEADRFNLATLVQKIRNRFSWNSSLTNQMESIAVEVFTEKLGDIITKSVSNKKRVFKNVRLVPISRNVLWRDHTTGVSKINPAWFTNLDSIFPYLKFYRNFVYNSEKSLGNNPQVYWSFDIITGTRWWSNEAQQRKLSWETNWASFDNTKSWTTTFNGNVFNGVYVAFDNLKQTNYEYFELATFKQKGLSLIIPTYKYKLAEANNLDSDELDFTRQPFDEFKYILLIPDYERRTHVLATTPSTSRFWEQKHFNNLLFDENDYDNPNKGKPIYPFIAQELFELEKKQVSDNRWRRGLLASYIKSMTTGIWKNYKTEWTPFYLPINTLWSISIGSYIITYKTWYSKCDNKKTCDYQEFWSDYGERVDGYRSGKSDYYLARVHRLDGDKIQFQVTITLPYSQALIEHLKKYDYLHKYQLSWWVINSEQYKGFKDLPIYIWKNGEVSVMNEEDKRRLGSKDVVAIWINPNDHTNWVNDLEKWGLINAEERRVLRNSYGNLFNRVNTTDDINWIHSSDNKLSECLWYLIRIFDGYNRSHEFWRGETDLIGIIPLKIYNDTAKYNRRSHNGYPELSTGFVRPSGGFDYMVYYRFTPEFDSHRFGFGVDKDFNFESKDYMVVVIPNQYGHSGEAVPKYTYRQKITELTRDIMIAFLVNSTNVTKFSLILKRREEYSYRNTSDGWNFAIQLFDRMKKHVEYTGSYFWDELVNEQFESKRTCNPKSIKASYEICKKQNSTAICDRLTFSTLDDEIPSFMVKYLDPDSALADPLHSWKKSTSTTDEARLQEWREKLEHSITYLKQVLSTQNTWFKLEGSEWYISVKLNSNVNQLSWDAELFTTNPTLIKSRSGNKWVFNNHIEEDVDVLINTSNEINLYGKAIPQKSRYFSEEDELDINLVITPLDDEKQTQAASWYKVDMKTEDQDLVRTVVEVPKELTRYSQLNMYERERLSREITRQSIDHKAELDLRDQTLYRLKSSNAYEASEIARHYWTKTAMGAVDFTAGSAKSIAAGFSLDAKGSISGIEQALKGAITMENALREERNKTIFREARYSIGLSEHEIRGRMVEAKHEATRNDTLAKMWQISSKIEYPQMNNGLIYKLFNKSESLNDVYIVQYYPSGRLLEYIKMYYMEYGYEILVRNFVCYGIDSIKRHLRFSNVFSCTHGNSSIKKMIEARAYNGIYVTDTPIRW